jgi:hypothetical protein
VGGRIEGDAVGARPMPVMAGGVVPQPAVISSLPKDALPDQDICLVDM